MAKHNLSRLDSQACPCQETLEFGLAEPLVRVKERQEYENEAQSDDDWARIENALEMHISLNDDMEANETLEKVRNT